MGRLCVTFAYFQALLLELGGPEMLTRLLGSGPDVGITQPAAYAAANLAARNSAAQTALREAGNLPSPPLPSMPKKA